jgi:AcrR family transcriptional regulator
MSEVSDSAVPTAETLTTSERLIVGAATLFREKGYAATTTRELSALLGLQNASLYHHISGKEELLYRLCVGTLEEVRAAFAEIVERDLSPIQMLEEIARRYTEMALTGRDRHATMLIEMRSLSTDLRNQVVAARDQNLTLVRETIARAQGAGEVRTDIEPKYLALALFNLLNWSIFWWQPEGEKSATDIADVLWRIFLPGVIRTD